MILNSGPLCNKKRDRAPHIGGKCFFLCWRCSGLVIGYFFSYLLITKGVIIHYKFSFIVMVMLLIPFIIDVYQQYFLKRLSNNFNRSMSGFLCGVSLALMFP